ncbi:hypothetical protein LUZ60_007699 [Juncus effusus]|nr:hypothetical protein LUZ60_007699 [Juncus effusus]
MIGASCCFSSTPASSLRLPTQNPKTGTPSLPFLQRKTTTKRTLILFLFSLPLSVQISAAAAAEFDPVSEYEKKASADVSRRVGEAVGLLELARDFQAKGDFPQALLFFTQLVKDYKDFALSEYARVGRALVLYEIGDRDEAIAEMEDVSISLKGYPEIHAALAAALYVDKHAPLLAENQFAIATLLDPHYTDLSYVRETKHWPPSLVSSLQHFITLS